jgi:hypothetical protein
VVVLATFHTNNINDLDRDLGVAFLGSIAPAKGVLQEVHREQVLMSSPAFAIPPDLTRDTGAGPVTARSSSAATTISGCSARPCWTPMIPYKPAVLDWPKLGEKPKRITALPIWDIAVQTENRAGLNVCTYAEGADALLRKAIELNGFEERRHRHVLANLVEAYGIKLAPEPVYESPRIRNGPSWSPAIASASIPSSPSACSRLPRIPAISRRNWSRPSIPS